MALLDGSAGAEQALPYAERLTRCTGSRLLLARIAPVTRWNAAGSGRLIWPHLYDEAIARERDEAQSYLNTCAGRLAEHGVTVETIAPTGDPETLALAIEADVRVVLLVMASHGRTGVAHMALGSIAETLIRKGRRPVLVVHPQETVDGEAPLARALVPLDGSPLAEESFHIVRQFAGSVFHQVTLLRVIALDAPASEADEAREALQRSQAALSAAIDNAAAASNDATRCEVASMIAYGDAATHIDQVARRVGDVIVMTTHGRTGLARLAMGSVAEQVLQTSPVPLLLTRPHVALEDSMSPTERDDD